ncbi:hypothetical protein FQ192_31285 [Pseudomonas sp. ANT_J12]|uniref:Peptidase U49 n=1 Tax=Pseudomonas prosekii TaxID=1148509 RepID=A0A2U2D6U3_9PSED|nr:MULTISPECIES: hypothetical protein [Pseudomonas]KAA0982683.1 hypothetical protein FQ192_31285 [Pseudomonas sp. ANT_J12]PWE43684.1 hypothetical protein C9I49_15370 [Pseudomonas prosekii]
MSDVEINCYAMDVIAAITGDLNESKYKKLGGKLSVVWSEEKKFNAQAPLSSVFSDPPDHKIIINYELVRQLYRDAENFIEFTQDRRTITLIAKFPADFMSLPLLPDEFTKENCIKNMFLASLTWIYFHELAHLNQEHGVVRADGDAMLGMSYADELEIDIPEKIQGREALLYHTTELAADAEATTRCISELLRHFADPKRVNKTHAESDLIAASYLLLCGLSCVFYRFNGGVFKVAEDYPSGTHPNSIFRLELIIPRIYETLELLCKGLGYKATRKELLKFTKQAADLGALFTHFHLSHGKVDISTLVVRGLLGRGEYNRYMQKIVGAWDEVEVTIRKNTRYPVEPAFLTFTEQYRKFIFGAR